MAVCSVHSIHWLCYFGRLLIFSLIHHSLFLYFFLVLDYSSFCALATSHHRRSDSPKFEWLYNSIDICNTPVVYSSIHLFRFQFFSACKTKQKIGFHNTEKPFYVVCLLCFNSLLNQANFLLANVISQWHCSFPQICTRLQPNHSHIVYNVHKHSLTLSIWLKWSFVVAQTLSLCIVGKLLVSFNQCSPVVLTSNLRTTLLLFMGANSVNERGKHERDFSFGTKTINLERKIVVHRDIKYTWWT